MAQRYIEESENGAEILWEITASLTQLLVIIPASAALGAIKRKRS